MPEASRPAEPERHAGSADRPPRPAPAARSAPAPAALAPPCADAPRAEALAPGSWPRLRAYAEPIGPLPPPPCATEPSEPQWRGLRAAAPVASASPEEVASCARALATLVPGFDVSKHRRPRREALRQLRRRIPADPAISAALLGLAATWAASIARATARGWADLARARAAASWAPESALWRVDAAPCRAGLVVASSVGPARADARALAQALERQRTGFPAQVGSRLPWLHLVGTYGRALEARQMLADAHAVMRGIALTPAQHAWALFGHGDHWHLVASRIGADGRRWEIGHCAAVALTVDCLEAESGWRRPYDAPGSRSWRHAIAVYARMDEGALIATRAHRGPEGAILREAIPLQGPAWAARVAQIAPHPSRRGGLLVLRKPGYAGLEYIVPHCVDG